MDQDLNVRCVPTEMLHSSVTTMLACGTLCFFERLWIRIRRARRESYGRELQMLVNMLLEKVADDEEQREDANLAKHGML